MSAQAPGDGAGCRGREILRLPRLTILFPPSSLLSLLIPADPLLFWPGPISRVRS